MHKFLAPPTDIYADMIKCCIASQKNKFGHARQSISAIFLEGGRETMPVFEVREEGIIVPAKSSRFYACLGSLAD